jgi:hypothetical protein
VIAGGAAGAEDLTFREIGEPQMTDAAIWINGSRLGD